MVTLPQEPGGGIRGGGSLSVLPMWMQSQVAVKTTQTASTSALVKAAETQAGGILGDDTEKSIIHSDSNRNSNCYRIDGDGGSGDEMF